jgi:arabinose-5-phosphate isomerase
VSEIEIVPEVVRVLKMEGEAILNCMSRLKDSKRASQLTLAFSLFQKSLSSGGKIVLTGVGKSGKIAQKIAATLCSTGSLAVYIHPTEGLHGDLGLVQSGDVVLALSNTGNTDEVVRLLPTLKNQGVAVVGMGGNLNSKLAESCDAWIDAEVENEACPHNLAPTTSTTLALALGDAIAITLMQLRGFDEKSFARNHPGGGLGKRLHLKVQDLMQSGKTLPLLGPTARMEQVIVVSTEKKLGAVLIVERNQLLGIITDGDLRRALQHKEKFFSMTAEQVMTKNPVTADAQMMAQEALKLMEERPSQISVLPVVDSENNYQGLLRLHDLLRSI